MFNASEKKMKLKETVTLFAFLIFIGFSTPALHAAEKVIIGGVENVALLPCLF